MSSADQIGLANFTGRKLLLKENIVLSDYKACLHPCPPPPPAPLLARGEASHLPALGAASRPADASLQCAMLPLLTVPRHPGRAVGGDLQVPPRPNVKAGTVKAHKAAIYR